MKNKKNKMKKGEIAEVQVTAQTTEEFRAELWEGFEAELDRKFPNYESVEDEADKKLRDELFRGFARKMNAKLADKTAYSTEKKRAALKEEILSEASMEMTVALAEAGYGAKKNDKKNGKKKGASVKNASAKDAPVKKSHKGRTIFLVIFNLLLLVGCAVVGYMIGNGTLVLPF